MIAIVDYGMGNTRSLINALETIGCEATVTASESDLQAAKRIVLPGVGAFGNAMEAIRSRGLDRILTEQVRVQRKPMLGVCLGMQILAQRSFEHGEHAGLGWLDADILRIDAEPPLKVPHVGWNDVTFARGEPLFEGVRPAESNFYFVHSFHMVCRNPTDVIATTEYGARITAAVRQGNIVATQFHPEKSQDNGLRLLRNWVSWTPEC